MDEPRARNPAAPAAVPGSILSNPAPPHPCRPPREACLLIRRGAADTIHATERPTMLHARTSRRRFLGGLGAAAGALWAAGPTAPGQGAGQDKEKKPMLHLATNQYPWSTFFRRDGRDFEKDLDAGLGEVAAAELDGFEPIVTSAQQVDQLAPLLKKHSLAMRSLYVNTTLHDRKEAEASIEHVLAVAAKAKPLGTRIIVTNPNPLRWGGAECKDDVQLEMQADALGRLGQKLAATGLTLAYHYHEPELRCAAREFHHMMVATDPKAVSLCLDAHWTFRGSGNSAVAVYDAAKLYGPRIAELHLRQSAKGTWTEAFGDGDIDYPRLAKQLAALAVRPHIVLEQAVEQGTPKTLTPVEAHRKGAQYARQVFATFADRAA